MIEAERVCAHEAGHAAACVALGVPVRVIDVAGDGLAGRVDHDFEIRSPGDVQDRMLIILAGMVESAPTRGHLPSWPLRYDATTDERNLAHLAYILGLDADG